MNTHSALFIVSHHFTSKYVQSNQQQHSLLLQRNEMGNLLSIFRELIGMKTEHRILMVGLDGAGKTTTLYKLKLGEVINTIPTIGFNVEQVTWRNLNFVVWDVGGQDRIRPLWQHYFVGVQGVIFIVDSSDTERLDEAKVELHKLFDEPQLEDSCFLIYANKQDQPHALSQDQIASKLQLYDKRLAHKWFVQSSSATTGDGLYEGLEQLARMIKLSYK
jgi:ADP-ribosylation factor protein 1